MSAPYEALIAASAKEEAVDNLESLNALEAIERMYSAELSKLLTKWEALPAGERKDSAETNANDTCSEQVFPYEDQVAWLMCALATYDLT